MKSRRDLLKWCGLSLVAVTRELSGIGTSWPDQGDDPEWVTEDQRGDPDTADEFVTFSPFAIRHRVIKIGKATFEDWDPHLSVSMIATARSFIGYSRKANPGQVSKFLALFDLPLTTNTGDVPFCAAGLSYCALTTYAKKIAGRRDASAGTDRLRKLMPDLEHYYFYPTVSCVDMYHIAVGKRKWVPYSPNATSLPKPGWIVLYDWKKRGVPDHCGLVQRGTKDSLVTIEFNTSTGEGSQRNGGTVAEKIRTYEYVTGFVITDAKP